MADLWFAIGDMFIRTRSFRGMERFTGRFIGSAVWAFQRTLITVSPMRLFAGNGVVDGDRGVDLGGDVLDEVGFIAPLLDGSDSALVEDLESADGLELFDRSVFIDDGVEGDGSLNVGCLCHRGIDGR